MTNSRRWLNHFSLVIFVFALLQTLIVYAGPNRTTYQAKIVKPDGYPLQAVSVNFRFTILDPTATCVLYSENYNNVNMSASSGLVSFSLGSGIKSFPVSATTFEQVFSNTTPFLSCDAGGPANYSPLANDIRRIVMQFNDGNGWQTLPAMSINAVPYAMYANDSQTLAGLQPSEFVQVSTLPSCGVSESLHFNGSSFSCVAVGGSGAVTSGSVITALGYTPVAPASFTAVSSEVSSVSSTVASVSSYASSVSATVASFQSTVAASFSAITSSQWSSIASGIHYSSGYVGIGTSAPAAALEIVNMGAAASNSLVVSSNSQLSGIFEGRNNATSFLNTTGLYVTNNAASNNRRTGLSFGLKNVSDTALISAQTQDSVSGYGRLQFGTRGNDGLIERMTITASGSVGIGTVTPFTKLDVIETDSTQIVWPATLRNGGNVMTPGYGAGIRFKNSGEGGTEPNKWSGIAGIALGGFSHQTGLVFYTANSASPTEVMRIDYLGRVGIGTTSPVTQLDVSGGVRIGMDSASCSLALAGTLRYNSGVVEYCNGTSWAAFGVSGSGILALNGLVSGSQTFAIGSAGTTPSVSSVGSVHTFNFPLASAASVTGGLLSNADYVAFASKLNSTSAAVISALSYTPANQSSVATSFAAVTTTTNNLGTSISALSTSMTTLSSQQSATAASLAAVTSSQWITSGTSIHYLNGYVGIGTNNPNAQLHIQGIVDQQNLRIANTSATMIVGEDSDLPSVMRMRSQVGSGIAITGNNDTPGIFVNSANSNVAVGGLHVPSAALHLRAGATSLAPLKFTSGPLTSSAQAGAMEFDGNFYYLTDNANVRRTIATGSVAGAIDNASVLNAPGNITLVPNSSVMVSSTLASTNPNTGALVVKGGVGIGGDLNVSGTVTAANAVLALSTGAVGIGVSVPITKVDIRSEAGLKGFRLQYSGTGFSTQPNLELHRSRGTIEAPTAVLANDVLGSFSALGYDGSSFGSGSTGAILIRADQNFSSGNHGTYMTFATTASGTTTQAERMRLDDEGNLGLGTTNPTAKLEVNGAIKVSQNAGTFFYMRESASSGTPTYDGMRWSYEEDVFGTNYDGMVFEKTDVNGSSPDGGFLFASRGNNNTRNPSLGIRSWGVTIGTSSTPLGPLHVYAGNNPALALEDDDDGIVVHNFQPTLTFKDASVSDPDDIRIRAESSYFHFESSPDFFVSSPVTTSLMTLRPNGNLGLGDTNPGYNLSIIASGTPATIYMRQMAAGKNDPSKIVIDETTDNAGQFWIQPTDDFDGAGSAQDKFHIGDYDSKQARFTVMGNGYVGVGTSAPTSLLEVSSGSSGDAVLTLESDTDDNNEGDNPRLIFSQDGGSVGMILGFSNENTGNSGNTFSIARRFGSVEDYSNFTINTSNGNVGIGTSAPSTLLHISGSGTGTTRGLRITATASGPGAYSEAQFAADGREFRLGVGGSAENAHGVANKFYIYDGAANTMRMVIDTLGNVGVGTALPSARLDVSRPTVSGSQIAVVNNTSEGYITVPTSGEGLILSSSRYDGANWVTDSSGAGAITVNNGSIQFFTNTGLTSGSTHAYSERARFDANGNFMIGTSLSNDRLTVASSGATYFTLNTTNGSHKRSGIYFKSNGTTQMEIGVDANVSGGRDFYIFDSVSNTQRVVVTSTGNVGINHGSPTYLLQLGTDSAAKPGTNTWTIASDMRLKDSRAPFTRGLDELLGLETIYFSYKKNNPLGLPSDKEYVGIRAQDVQKVIPESVRTDEKGFLHFTSDAVFWTAVNAIKQLYHKVVGHDVKLELQERQIASIKEENELLKQQNADKDKQLNEIRAYLCAKDPAAPICK